MGTEFAVIPQRLKTMADRWQYECEELEKELRAVRETVTRMAGYWQGKGAQIYQNYTITELDRAVALTILIRERSMELIKIAVGYEQTESDNMAIAEALADRMPEPTRWSEKHGGSNEKQSNKKQSNKK
ncbi:MAG: hypothetical protein LBV33_06325 [Lachnospiraceae bacterium]|nr:hypothetical protein [Lachnospiraceae bacterium]